MTVVLFCELSGSLVVTAADLNHIASTLCLPNFCMLSRETAIAFEDDAEKAASLVSEGGNEKHLKI